MALQLLKSTASSVKSWDHVQPWWTGWKAAGLSRWFLNCLESRPSYRICRIEKDGWVDFFFGRSAQTGVKVHSILEGQSRVGLHFSSEDVDILFGQDCPSAEIPAHLWDLLQQEIRFCRS